MVIADTLSRHYLLTDSEGNENSEHIVAMTEVEKDIEAVDEFSYLAVTEKKLNQIREASAIDT